MDLKPPLEPSSSPYKVPFITLPHLCLESRILLSLQTDLTLDQVSFALKYLGNSYTE
jgi:hypothetical protein